MKVLGLLSIIVMAAIGYCAYNLIVINPAEVSAEVVKQSSSGDCKGPFGFDSQKISPETLKYEIGVVSKIDLEKNPDGSWYVASCKFSNKIGNVHFTSPYPQQNDLREGDFIGFTASLQGVRGSNITYGSGKIFENISARSAKCKIDDLPQSSTPYAHEYMSWMMSFEKLNRPVTGVVMALNIGRNPDPEPDNPSDYLIYQVVMKCADGNLYLAGFSDAIDCPSHGTFVEGDIITVTQTIPVDDDPTFSADWNDLAVASTDTRPAATDDTKRNPETPLMSYPVENFEDDMSYPVVSVIDGNTVVIDDNGRMIECRLIGVRVSRVTYGIGPDIIDFADGAHKFTKKLLLGETVYMRSDRNVKDSFGKQMVYLYRAPDGLFVNLEIIRQGYGHVPLTGFKFDKLFLHYEAKALEGRKGAYEKVNRTQ